MTTKQIQRQIAILRNKLERATTKPDPTGEICEGLRREIANLQAPDTIRALFEGSPDAAFPRAAIVQITGLDPKRVSAVLKAMERTGDVECVLDDDGYVWEWIGDR